MTVAPKFPRASGSVVRVEKLARTPAAGCTVGPRRRPAVSGVSARGECKLIWALTQA